VLENEEPDRDTSKKANVKWDTREAIDILISELYYLVTIDSRERYNLSNM